MKRYKKKSISKHPKITAVPARKMMRVEGKFLHGTRGKETRGSRGNKKF
jgi:hypothetical protein